MKPAKIASLFSLILLPGCALYHDLRNPERIEPTSLHCKTSSCLKIAQRRIQDSTSVWRYLKSSSKSFILESSYHPLEGAAHGSAHLYQRGKLISSEEWVDSKQHKSVRKPESGDPFEELTQKCLELSSISEPASHQYYCFAFSPDGLLSSCGQYGYWPKWQDATCLGEKFQVRSADHERSEISDRPH